MRAIFLCLLLLSITIQAQTWAPSGAKWTYMQGIWSGPDTNLAVIENVGDTTINGLLYSRLSATTGSFICFPFYEFIRYDGDSLWFLDDATSGPHLLWCMNALPGQSWQTTLTWGGIPADTITWTAMDTATVVVDGVALRQVELSYSSATQAMPPYCWSTCRVTERLGNWKYLFDFQHGPCDAETFLGLRCYEDPDITWLNPKFPGCDLETGMADNAITPLFTVNPNPASAGAVLLIGLPMITKGSGGIEILEPTGRIITSIPVRSQNTEVIMPGPGVFLIRVSDDTGYSTTQQVVVY
jgi:hypothetical protein